VVKEIENNGKKYYMCEACDMYYETHELSEKCEKYCNEKYACNIEITKFAIKIRGKKL
jgi:hypothetical protein